MEAEVYKCSGCGSPIDASMINFKTRRASCPWCGKEIIFPKRNSTASPNAVQALNEAMRFFNEKNFVSAKNCAETVVSMVPNNLPALFIIAYYNAFVSTVKSRISWNNLFNNVLPEAIMEIEEEEIFKTLLLKTILHSCDFEEQIITRFSEFDDDKEVIAFIEQFCPLSISKRQNVEWFTPAFAEVLLNVTKKGNIPKTWLALLTTISKNPDSPLVSGEFYLVTKVNNFYNNVVLRTGEILNNIRDEQLKSKFIFAYNKIKSEFEIKIKNKK